MPSKQTEKYTRVGLLTSHQAPDEEITLSLGANAELDVEDIHEIIVGACRRDLDIRTLEIIVISRSIYTHLSPDLREPLRHAVFDECACKDFQTLL
jgi:hypothetical protein